MLRNITVNSVDEYTSVDFDVMLTNVSGVKIEYATGALQPAKDLIGSPLETGESLPAYVINGAKCWVIVRLRETAKLSVSDIL